MCLDLMCCTDAMFSYNDCKLKVYLEQQVLHSRDARLMCVFVFLNAEEAAEFSSTSIRVAFPLLST